MWKLIRTNFDRHERRRERRAALPRLDFTIGQEHYETQDWSLSGFRPATPLNLAIGTTVEGVVRVSGGGGRAYRFTATAVRCDGAKKAVGFRFLDRSEALLTMLDRAAARLILGGR